MLAGTVCSWSLHAGDLGEALMEWVDGTWLDV